MILGIDTSIGTAVAIVDHDGTVRAEVASADPRGHAEVIGILLVQVLDEAGVTSADITHVAAGMGPGPFTGLRVGIAAARAFALGRGIPVIPVVSHDAAALARAGADGPPRAHSTDRRQDPRSLRARGPIVVVTDARRREIAYSVYSPDAWPQRLQGPTLAAKGADLVIEGIDLAAEAETTTISAADLARIAARRLVTGETDATASDPLYLRAPDVSAPAGRKKVGV